MKKIILLFVLICSVFLLVNSQQNTFASEVKEYENYELVSTETTYVNDGYIICDVYETIKPTRNAITLFANTGKYTKSGVKTQKRYDANNNLLWEYTLIGYFTVDTGVSCVCNSTTYRQTIYNSSWSFSDGNTSHSGNQAFGTGTFTKKILFITTNTEHINLTVTVDEYGIVS